MSFRSKVENFWYHYKSVVLIGIFLIFTLLFCLHSCVTKTEYDIQVYYVVGSSSMYTEQLDWIQQTVAAHCGDVNGDGQVAVAITGLRVGQYSDTSQRAQYMTPVQAGEIMLFFGDLGGMEYLYEKGYLQDISSYVDNPESNYLWKVNGTGVSTQLDGFELFSDVDLYVALRTTENTVSMSSEEGEQNFKIALDTLQSMTSAVSRYDLRVYWLTTDTQVTANQIQWIENAVSAHCPDTNEDGAVVVDVSALNLAKETTREKYLNAIRTQDRYLLFGDEGAMTLLGEENLLHPLDGVEPLHENGAAWLVNGSAVASRVEGFTAFGKKVYAALRYDTVADGAESSVQSSAATTFARFFISEE